MKKIDKKMSKEIQWQHKKHTGAAKPTQIMRNPTVSWAVRMSFGFRKMFSVASRIQWSKDDQASVR